MSGPDSLWLAKRSTSPGIAWPPLTNGAPAALEALTHQLEQTQWLPAPEIAAHQYRQLQIVARHAATYSPHFRRRLEQAGLRAEDLATPEALGKVPFLSRRDLRPSNPEAYCAGVPKDHLPINENRTSGSTGEPVMVKRTAISQLFWLAIAMREYFWYERDFSLRYTCIRPTITAYQVLDDWGPPASLLFRTGRRQLIPITMDIAEMVNRMAEFRPHVLIVFPNVLDAIVQHCRTNAIRMPELSLVRSISETLTPRVRKEAEDALNVRVDDNYSSQEAGIIALQCPESGLYHLMSESLIVEIVDDDGRVCAEGEVGRIVITDLHNFATPVIRYDIGDYAEVGGACRCGRGLPTLKRVLGRARNLVRMPDGTKHYPLVGYSRFHEIAPILQFQFVQYGRTEIEGRLVTEKPLSETQEEALRKVVQESLGYPFAVRFAYYLDRLPRSPGGKFEEFISTFEGDAREHALEEAP